MGNADLRFSTEAKKNHLPPSRDSDLLNDAASPVTVLVVQMAKLRPNSLVIQDVRDSLNCHSQSRFKPQPSHGRRNGCSGPQSGLSESGRAGSVAEISLQTTLPTNWRMCVISRASMRPVLRAWSRLPRCNHVAALGKIQESPICGFL